MIKSIILSTLFLICIFPIELIVLPRNAWLVVYHGLPIVYLLYNYRTVLNCIYNTVNNNNMFKVSCVLLYTSFIWALFTIMINGTELSYLGYMAHFVTNSARFMMLLLIIKRYYETENIVVTFIRFYAIGVSLYVISSLIMLINLDLRIVWQSLIHTQTLVDVVNQEGLYVTRFGLQGWSGFGNTVLCSLGIVLSGYLICFYKYRWYDIAAIPVMLLGNAFYGRSGLFFSIICILILCLQNVKVKYIKKAVCILFIGIVSIYIILSALSDVTYVEYWFQWIMNPIDSFIASLNGSKVSFGSSGDGMFNMYYLPESDITVFFGDGIYETSTGYYSHADVGLMRNMLFFGLLGTGLLYLSALFLIKSLCNIYENKSSSKIMFIIFVIFFGFFEIKGNPYAIYYGILFTVLMAVNLQIKTNGDKI